MGQFREGGAPAQIDAWLRAGGLVVAASERAARFVAADYHRSRRAEGLTAWQSPNIRDWQTFARSAWDAQNADGRFVLNVVQEHSIWAAIIARFAPDAAHLAGTRDRIASLAMEAHQLLCVYAPQYLKEKARIAWNQDAAAFSLWLAEFDAICGDGNLISADRLPLELIHAARRDSNERPPILLVGFDRILPVQRAVFDAWGTFDEAPMSEPATRIEFHSAADAASELAACSIWCRRQLEANPAARLLVITQDISQRRGEIERTFLRYTRSEQSSLRSPSLFEFSLGVPLNQIALVRSAGLVLRWLNGPIEEHQLDWLISTGHTTATPEESRELAAFLGDLRRRRWQRTTWTFAEFIRQRPKMALPSLWVARLTRAQLQWQEAARRIQPPLAWAELVPRLLQTAGWPGHRPLTSDEFQAHRRWQQAVDDCASLGFDGRRMEWNEFLAALDRTLAETLFTPESEDAPILITGPAESAGLAADSVWFLDASEDGWPAAGATHPLLPLAVQREAGMPHATAQLDWDLANATTYRLLASATQVHFSYAGQVDGVDTRPSRLIAQIAGAPQPLTAGLIAPPIPAPLAVETQDAPELPFPPDSSPGGTAILTTQSQCPFRAFAAARLGADGWDPAEPGLTAIERGQLVHEVLHSVWAGPQAGIRSHADLVALPDLHAFVAGHVRNTLRAHLPTRALESMPPRYLALEETRLINLVTEWLRYESARVPFTVLQTERKSAASIAGLPLHLRLDRIDRLIDGSLFVIDYKTGDPKTNAWNLPRPDDVQLPLYANFALEPDQGAIGGLAFAKVRTGEAAFVGFVRNAKATLRGDLRGNTNLVRKPLTPDQLAAWRDCIEQLARDFLAGHAAVDPREYPETCANCTLHALCRVQEFPPESEDANGEEAADA
jgi:ATP-dependent helicase/nuclease subunit B